jgi:protein O-mannosyl-transferase
MPLLIALITFVVFTPALHNGFITFDDDRNFVNNMSYRGLGFTELRWMWTTFHTGHYVPLTWMTLGLDFTLWGMSPVGYHFTNIVLHAGAAALGFRVAERLLRAGGVLDKRSDTLSAALPPAFAALLFALHPLRVESVAWVTERRDVLSMFFALASLLAYLRTCEPSATRRRYYWLSVGLFACGLLSKATIMTLPAVLLVLDVYPLRRLGGTRGWWSPDATRVYLEKIPYFVLSIAAAIVSIVALPARPQLGLVSKIVVSAYGLSF